MGIMMEERQSCREKDNWHHGNCYGGVKKHWCLIYPLCSPSGGGDGWWVPALRPSVSICKEQKRLVEEDKVNKNY